MRASRLVLLTALVALLNADSTFAASPPSDQAAAEQVLGPQWKQLSRRAGMIFAGTVLSAPPRKPTSQTDSTNQQAPPETPPFQLTIRVDHAIAGVDPGQILTLHEWAGLASMPSQPQRPMSPGQRFLLFLYPPSRLGLTSPVGGSQGQIALDPSGQHISNPSPRPTSHAALTTITVVQLARAIRSAREE
jgi:hypothetical protein